MPVFCASLLVLPLAALLFVQWPLREWIQAWSREANDAAQVLFALYVAVAVTAATWSGNHLAAFRTTAQKLSAWRPWALLLCLGPWALFVLWTAAPQVWQSIAQLEHFPDTSNPGYFSIKLAGCLLPAIALVEALVRAFKER